MKAIKLQSGNKFHHYWFPQYTKQLSYIKENLNLNFGQSENFIIFSMVLFHPPSWIIVQSDDCFSICHLEFLSNHRPSCHLELLSNQKTAFHPPSWIFDQSETSCPPTPPSWHRTLTFTLLKCYPFLKTSRPWLKFIGMILSQELFSDY